MPVVMKRSPIVGKRESLPSQLPTRKVPSSTVGGTPCPPRVTACSSSFTWKRSWPRSGSARAVAQQFLVSWNLPAALVAVRCCPRCCRCNSAHFWCALTDHAGREAWWGPAGSTAAAWYSPRKWLALLLWRRSPKSWKVAHLQAVPHTARENAPPNGSMVYWVPVSASRCRETVPAVHR